MKTYNSPGQARSLREIEAAAASPSIQIMRDINGTVQPVSPAVEKEKEEAWPEAKTETSAKKARSKKNTTKV